MEVRDERDKRVSIISNWSSLVCINLDAFTLSDTLVASGSQVAHSDVEVSLTACFSRKATSTLSKRFYCMNRFVNYCCRNGLQFFPIREHVVFTYLKHLVEDEKTAPSTGRSLFGGFALLQWGDWPQGGFWLCLVALGWMDSLWNS